MEGKTCLWDLALVPVRDEGGLAREGRREMAWDSGAT